MEMFDLTGKVAVVTGASRGIGEAIATAFARHGAKIVLAARKLDGLAAVEKKLHNEGHDAIALACHTGKAGEVTQLFKAAVDRFQKIDVLVNNAATNPHFGRLVDASEAQLDKIYEVNVKGYFHCAQALVRHLQERNA